MKTFLVGGAVRDALLGRTPKDQDFVVVGATKADVEQMMADGFQQVGADFPVFLHPRTGNEYALARVERKTGKGHRDFTADTENVTLEEDLVRRDLTINAMAQDLETGEIFDPFGGQNDLDQGILRHVSEAFAEDPLRVLRVARFAARYSFTVATETIELMRKIVAAGELEHLSRERVWVELEKLLNETDAVTGLMVLDQVGALRSIFADPTAPTALPHVIMNRSEFNRLSAMNKFITFAHWFRFSDDWLAEMRVPTEVRKGYKMFLNVHDRFSRFDLMSDVGKLTLFNEIRAFSDMTMFDSIKPALLWKHPLPIIATFNDKLNRAKLVDCAAIALANRKNPADAIFIARLNEMAGESE